MTDGVMKSCAVKATKGALQGPSALAAQSPGNETESKIAEETVITRDIKARGRISAGPKLTVFDQELIRVVFLFSNRSPAVGNLQLVTDRQCG